jgi:hypothetical protein
LTGELTYCAANNIEAQNLQTLWASIGIYRSSKIRDSRSYEFNILDYTWHLGMGADGADGSYIATFTDPETYIMAKLAT